MAGPKECFDFLNANVKVEESLASADFDYVVYVATSTSEKALGKAQQLSEGLAAAEKCDATFNKQV